MSELQNNITSLQELIDNVRELRATTESTVDTQESLMIQIAESLVGKTASGGVNVTAEVAEYSSLLDELEETIDDLSDGGGAVETCTLTVAIDNERYETTIWDVVYTTLDNGVPVVHISTNKTTIGSGSTYTLNNVVVGRPVSFVHYTTGVNDTITNGEIVYHTSVSDQTSVFLPTVANAVVSIVLGGEFAVPG